MTSGSAPHLTELFHQFRRLPAARSGAAFLLWGGPGIGKSFTAHQLARTSGAQVITVQAGTEFSKLVQTIASNRTSGAGTGPARPAHVFNLVSQTPTDLASHVHRLLQARAPAVLIAEDLHDASPERQALWSALAGMVGRSRRLGLLLTSRSSAEGFVQLELRNLNAEASTALLAELAEGTLPETASLWLYQRSGGNPLYLKEFFRWLRKNGHLWFDGQHWQWRPPPASGLPETLTALIVQQLRSAGHDAPTRALLLSWALFPAPLDQARRAHLAGLDAESLEAAARPAVSAGLLDAGGFTHPLFREVALVDGPVEERQAVARRAVQLFDASHAARVLPWAELPPRQGAAVLLRAARSERQRGQPGEAARLSLEAARLGVLLARPWAVPVALAAIGDLRLSDLRLARRSATWLLTLEPLNPEVLMAAAEFHLEAGETDEAEALLSRLPQAVQQGDWALRRLEMAHSGSDAPRLLELWEARPDLHARANVGVLNRVATMLVQTGRFEAARTLTLVTLNRDNLRPLERERLAFTLGNISWLQGDYGAAARTLGEIPERLAADDGDEARYLSARAAQMHGVMLWGLSRLPEAARQIETAALHFERLGRTLDHLHARGFLGAVLLDLGEFTQAEQVLLANREAAQTLGTRDQLAVDCTNLAQLYTEWQPPFGPVLALRYAAEGLQIARSLALPPLLTQALMFAAWVEAKHGNAARALPLAEESLRLASQIGQERGVALAHMVLGMTQAALGQAAEARASLSLAIQVLSDEGLHNWAQRGGLELDLLSGDRASAARRREQFLAWGAGRGVQVADRYFPHPTEGLPPRSPLSLHVLGRVEVRRDDGSVLRLQGRQAKTLLARLLEVRLNGLDGAGLPALLDALYPGVSERTAQIRLHALVHRVRETLGNACILTQADGYRLGAVGSDAEAFLQSGESHWWRGPYLDDLSGDTHRLAGGADAAAREGLITALTAATKQQLVSAPLEAARLARILMAEEPYEHGPVRLYLAALLKAGQHRQAARFYSGVRQSWREVGETLPDSWRRYLWQDVPANVTERRTTLSETVSETSATSH